MGECRGVCKNDGWLRTGRGGGGGGGGDGGAERNI